MKSLVFVAAVCRGEWLAFKMFESGSLREVVDAVSPRIHIGIIWGRTWAAMLFVGVNWVNFGSGWKWRELNRNDTIYANKNQRWSITLTSQIQFQMLRNPQNPIAIRINSYQFINILCLIRHEAYAGLDTFVVRSSAHPLKKSSVLR